MSHKSRRWSGGGKGRWAKGEGQGQCVSSRGQKVNCRALPPGPFIISLTQTDYSTHTASALLGNTFPLLVLHFPSSPSSLTWSSSTLSFPLLSLLFSCPLLSVCCRALCVLPCISQVLIKSLTSGAWIMFRLCFFFSSSLYSAHFLFFHLFLLALPFFLLSPAIMQEGRLNPQCSLSPLRPEIWHFLPAVTPSSYSSYFPFTFPSIPPPSTFSLNLSLILELINPAQGHDESARTLPQYWFLFSPSVPGYYSFFARLGLTDFQPKFPLHASFFPVLWHPYYAYSGSAYHIFIQTGSK